MNSLYHNGTGKNFEILGYNQCQLKNPVTFAPSTHGEFSISILKLNVKRAPEMRGFFN